MGATFAVNGGFSIQIWPGECVWAVCELYVFGVCSGDGNIIGVWVSAWSAGRHLSTNEQPFGIFGCIYHHII